MRVDHRPKLCISARGVNEHANSKSISYKEYSKSRDYSTGITENVQRALLPFDYLEVEEISRKGIFMIRIFPIIQSEIYRHQLITRVFPRPNMILTGGEELETENQFMMPI